jgi:hypothetical protein
MSLDRNAMDINALMAEEAEAYLTGYSTRFVEAPIGTASTYLDKYIFTPPEGVEERVRKVFFPIPLTAVELRIWKGRSRFTKGSTKYISVKKRPYQAGESAFYKMITDPAWTGFSRSPEHLRKLCASWPTKNAARLVNTGETIAHWKGTNFLSASVPSNPFRNGSSQAYRVFWNATTLTHPNVEAMIADIVNRRDLDDDPLPLGQLVLFSSAALHPTAMSVAKDPLIDETKISNPILKWNLQVEAWQHIDPTRWGLINTAAVDEYPIFNALIGADEFYTYARDSSMFEQKKEMGYEVMKDLGIAPARNEAICVADTTDVL